MLINLSEVFTLEGKEKTWEVPFEAKLLRFPARDVWNR